MDRSFSRSFVLALLLTSASSFAAETTPAATTAAAAGADAAKAAVSAPVQAAGDSAVKPATDATTAVGATTEKAKEAEAAAPVGKSKEVVEAAKSGRLLGEFSIGPTVAASFPHPANIGIEGRYTDYLGFAADYGFLPEVSVSSVKAKMKSWDVRARVFPFGGAFFLGAAYGQQTLTGSMPFSAQGLSTTAVGDIKTNFLTPHIGWRWGGRTGLIFGMDFGWQMAQGTTTAITSDLDSNALVAGSAEYQKAKDDITKVANTFGNTGLPNVTLIHIGYLF